VAPAKNANNVFSLRDDLFDFDIFTTTPAIFFHRLLHRSLHAIIGRFLQGLRGGLTPARCFGAFTKHFAVLATNMSGETVSGRAEAVEGIVGQPAKRVKLHGRAFYESIGSPKIVLAPMVEQSEFVRKRLFVLCIWESWHD
jgi:hypothetical protein